MNKKIAIVGWNIGENSFGVTKAYLNFLNNFGDVQIITPYQEIIKDLDLLILPGGRDVNPLRYNQIPDLFNSEPNSILEYFDLYKLPKYIKLNTPIFGICRGFQTLNVLFGGTLTQNYVHEYSSPERFKLVHDLSVVNLPEFNNVSVKTNSIHHQAIFQDDLSEKLTPTLLHNDGVIEGFIHKELPIAGVQYHPEEIFDDYSKFIINSLLNNNNNEENIKVSSNDTVKTS